MCLPYQIIFTTDDGKNKCKYRKCFVLPCSRMSSRITRSCSTDNRFSWIQAGSPNINCFNPISWWHNPSKYPTGVNVKTMIYRHHLFHDPFISSLLDTILGTRYSSYNKSCCLNNKYNSRVRICVCALQLPTVSLIKPLIKPKYCATEFIRSNISTDVSKSYTKST